MKALVTATCIAVLAVVGYFFYGEYARYADHSAHVAKMKGQQRYDECMDALVLFKNGPRGLEYPDTAENQARQCADFVNAWHGLPEKNRIAVSSSGVRMIPLN